MVHTKETQKTIYRIVVQSISTSP